MIVSELVVVIAVCGSSLVLTRFHARSASGLAATPHDLERMLAAVQRACADFLWQETRLLALLAGVVLLVLAGPTAAFAAPGSWRSALGWFLAALACGVAAGTLIAFVAHAGAARTTNGVLGALRHARNDATRVTLRGASALAVSIDALSTTLTAACFAAHYAFATVVEQLPAAVAVTLASRTLVALAFGALCAAVVFQVGGASLHTAAGVAGAGARARDPRIARDEEQNPLLVAELVGDHVGGVVSRSTASFCTFSLSTAKMLSHELSAVVPSKAATASASPRGPACVRGAFAPSVQAAPRQPPTNISISQVRCNPSPRARANVGPERACVGPERPSAGLACRSLRETSVAAPADSAPASTPSAPVPAKVQNRGGPSSHRVAPITPATSSTAWLTRAAANVDARLR